MSYANFLYDVIEPIARYHVRVSSRRDVQSRENRGLDYAVTGAGNVGEKMQPIITLGNRSVY
jgi:hypothetical protein